MGSTRYVGSKLSSPQSGSRRRHSMRLAVQIGCKRSPFSRNGCAWLPRSGRFDRGLAAAEGDLNLAAQTGASPSLLPAW